MDAPYFPQDRDVSDGLQKPRSTTVDRTLCDKCRSLSLATWLDTVLHENPSYIGYAVFGRKDMRPHRDWCELCALAESIFDELPLDWFSIRTGHVDGSICFIVGQRQVAAELSLVAINNDLPSKDGDFSLAKRSSTDVLDIPTVKSWIRACYSHPEQPCGVIERRSVDLRVIDCNTRQLRFIPPDCPYIALSYVWGNPTTKRPKDEWLAGQLPQTVEDAIIVAQQLDVPFLWVDRYCIDQDNPEEKHTIISSMDKIYQGAEATIIAAAGTDPNYGLPGISRPRKNRTAQVLSHTMAWRYYPRQEIARTKWSKRGWTYQEMLLSRRRLVFTESQTYFQCSDIDAVQSSCLYPKKGHFGIAFPHTGIGNSIYEVYDRIEEYSERELSYDSDALNAFDGIFSVFRSLGVTTHFWGIPIHNTVSDTSLASTNPFFLFGLTWQVPTNTVKYCTREFPSWSWASLKLGKISFSVQDRMRKPVGRNEIKTAVTHRFKGDMDLADYATQKDSYTRFLPWISIASYTAVVHHHITKNYHRWNGASDLRVFFDDHEKPDQADFIAVNLGLFDIFGAGTYDIEFLLVRELEPGQYRRIGIAAHRLPEEGRYEDDPTAWLPENAFDRQDRWIKQTLRLV